MKFRFQKTPDIPAIRAIGQFGMLPKHPKTLQLFLDDARNPPLKEKNWVVVRTVRDGQDFLLKYGHLVTMVSLDNDLGPDPQGYKLLEWILAFHQTTPFKQLHRIIVHTGNLPKGRLMMQMLKDSSLERYRVIPSDRLYPRASDDLRKVVPYH